MSSSVVEAAGAAYAVATVDLAPPATTSLGFIAEWILVRTNGTPAGTKPVISAGGKRITSAQSLTAAGRLLYFTAPLPTGTRRELWRTDGTAVGTHAVIGVPLDVQPIGTRGDSLLVSTGNAVLTVDEDGKVAELYRGAQGPSTVVATTPNGNLYLAVPQGDATKLVRVAPDGTATDLTDHIEGSHGVVGNSLYFGNVDAVHGGEPWVTDGTPAGTHMVQDLTPGLASSSVRFEADGRFVLAIAHPDGDLRIDGSRVYRLTPTTATPINADDGQPLSQLPLFVPAGDTTYVDLGTSVLTSGIGLTRHTVGPDSAFDAGTRLPREFFGGEFGFDGSLYFDEANGNRIMRYSGSGAPRVLATAERVPGYRANGPGELTGGYGAAKGLVYFTSRRDGWARLWRTDGTPAGTFPIIPAPSSAEIQLRVSGPDLEADPATVTGLLSFPSKARPSCHGAAKLTISRKGRVAQNVRVPLAWSGTGCTFSQLFAGETFKRRGPYTARATFGTGKTRATSPRIPIPT